MGGEILVMNHLGPYEALGHVRVDGPCCLNCSASVPYGPRSDLILPDGKERNEPQNAVSRPYEAFSAQLLYAGALRKLRLLFGRKLGHLHLQATVDFDQLEAPLRGQLV